MRRHRSRAVLLLAAALALWCPGAALAAKSDTGEWSAPMNFHPLQDQIVHLILMRSGGDSARVLYYGFNDSNPYLWSVETGAHLRLARADGGTKGIFCNGHSTLADGTALLSGGTGRDLLTADGQTLASSSYQAGYKGSFIFDPRDAHLASHGFTQTRSLALARWYSSNTTLADGSVLVTSGQEDILTMILAGSVSGAPVNTMTTLAHNETLTVQPRAIGGTSPAAREGHVAVYDNVLHRTLVFGGTNAAGTVIDDGVQALTRASDAVAPDQYTWSWLAPFATSGTRPSARHRHAATFESWGRSMFVVGGDSAGTGNQTWRFWSLTESGHSSNTWFREPDLDYAVRGHTATYVHGAGFQKILVFGGKSGGSWVNTVRTFDLPTRTWGTPATTGTPPSPREGHSAVEWAGKVYFFGGFDGTNYLNDMWVLDLNTTPWSWSLAPLRPGSSPPPVRARHAATIPTLAFPGVMIVHGGEYRDGGGQLVQRGDVWGVHTSPFNGYNWKEPLMNGTLPPRSRHAYVNDPRATLALTPERYVPPAGGYELFGQSANKTLFTYPLAFALPNHKYFYCGDTDHLDHMDQVLDLATNTWETATHGVQGTTAVMYRPGQILKYGGNPTSGTPSFKIDFNGSGTWVSAGSVPEAGRIHHHLVALPTGKVLLLGGNKPSFGDSIRRNPYLWDPTGGWSPTALAPEPQSRTYHSTALLLPDARVISAGGFVADTFYSATLFSPPYLFSGNALAARPEIQSAPRIVRYATAYTLTVPGATSIVSACLIRPGAVTHGFDQNQRYVPLTVSNPSGSTLSITAPSDSLDAPPGDYMLFVVDNAGVPSVAKWVRVCSDDVPPAANALAFQTGLLSWTAPGDDGNAPGSAVEFDLRYSATPITESNFYFATRIGAPVPEPQGWNHCAVATVPCGTYSFAVRSRDDAGNWSDASITTGTIGCADPPAQCPTVSRDDDGLPPFWVSTARPTPARDRVTVDFTVNAAGRAQVRVYDAAGRAIRTVSDAVVSGGRHSAQWDLRDDGGNRVAAGVYLVRVAWGTQVQETRAVVIQ